jgi:hypothetical protein
MRLAFAMSRSNMRNLTKRPKVPMLPRIVTINRTVHEYVWRAPGSEDTELGVLMELEVGHGETEVYPRVQA